MWQIDRLFHMIAIVWLGMVSGPTRVGFVVRAKPSNHQGLYSVDDDVIVLTKANFADRVYGKNMVWVIEFYNSWCGHCVNYAPTWKSFASDLKGWRRVISVGAVDCSSDENLEVCREYDIKAYPSIKLFPPAYSPELHKDRLTLVETQDTHDIKEQLLDYVTQPEFSAPTTWPRLAPLRSLGDIWAEAKKEHRFVAVVFEEEDSLVGREVILDVVDFPSLLVRCMRRKEVEKFGSFTYPSLYIINRDSSFHLLARGSGVEQTDRHTFVDKLLALLNIKDSEGKPVSINHQHGDVDLAGNANVVQFQQPEEKKEDKKEEKKEKTKEDTKPDVDSPSLKMGVYLQDLDSTLHYAFRQEIAICKTIEGPKLDALLNFLSALAKYYPGRGEVRGFLWKLVSHLRQLDGPLTGESWVKIVEDLQDQKAFLPDQEHWVGCKGSQPRFRGYPCGVWTLFHTLTVAAYQNTGTVNAQEVPLAIRGYMEHFFGCQHCSQHFLQMAADIEQKIRQPLDAVLWLWQAHNSANRRLSGDASEDPLHPKIQFPSLTDCPLCHVQKTSPSDSYPGWNISAVTSFLVRFYSKDNLIKDVAPSLSLSTEEGEQRTREKDWWEKQQREKDLKTIQELRERKKREKLEKLVAAKQAERERNTKAGEGRRVQHESHYDAMNESVKSRRLGLGWGLNNVDVGVCLVFYISCAVIILVVYYHLVVHRRFRLPCKHCLPV